MTTPAKTPTGIRLQIAQDLRELAQLLAKLNTVFPDVTPLYRAEEECKRDTGDKFQYRVQDLIFRIGTNKMKPIPNDLYDITASLSTTVCGPCISEDSDMCDPLETLDFNIVLTGKHANAGIQKSVHWAWHLDRDIGGTAGASTYIHPFYHFQAGGRMLNRGFSYGASLIVNAPRIAHPPMDAALGVDFILTNFLENSLISPVRDDSLYRRILINSQTRLWRPYIFTLAKAWELETSSWNSGLLWPQLVKGR